MNQTIAGKYPVFGVSYISPSFLRFSRAGSTGRRCGWLGSRSQPAGETVDPSAVNPQEEPGTIVIGYGPVGRTLTRLLRDVQGITVDALLTHDPGLATGARAFGFRVIGDS